MSSPPSSPPSSRRPAGVPESGNAKYAIIAIVLLARRGGSLRLAQLRRAPTLPVPVPPAPVAVEPPPANPKLDDIPLPPPVRREARGRARAEGRLRRRRADARPSATGRRRRSSSRPCKMRGAQARRCYNSALAQDSSLKGHVTDRGEDRAERKPLLGEHPGQRHGLRRRSRPAPPTSSAQTRATRRPRWVRRGDVPLVVRPAGPVMRERASASRDSPGACRGGSSPSARSR